MNRKTLMTLIIASSLSALYITPSYANFDSVTQTPLSVQLNNMPCNSEFSLIFECAKDSQFNALSFNGYKDQNPQGTSEINHIASSGTHFVLELGDNENGNCQANLDIDLTAIHQGNDNPLRFNAMMPEGAYSRISTGGQSVELMNG